MLNLFESDLTPSFARSSQHLDLDTDSEPSLSQDKLEGVFFGDLSSYEIKMRKFNNLDRRQTLCGGDFSVMLQSECLDLEASVVILQKWFRGLLGKKGSAVLKIQRVYRGWKVRVLYSKSLRSIILIQRLFRSSQIRKGFIKKKLSCIIIQANFRIFRLEKIRKIKNVDKQMKITRSALIIQKYFRSFRHRSKYIIFKSKVIKIQRFIRQRKIILVKLTKERAILNSVVKIQTWYRGLKARKSFIQIKISAVKIQTFVRLCYEKRNQKKSLEEIKVVNPISIPLDMINELSNLTQDQRLNLITQIQKKTLSRPPIQASSKQQKKTLSQIPTPLKRSKISSLTPQKRALNISTPFPPPKKQAIVNKKIANKQNSESITIQQKRPDSMIIDYKIESNLDTAIIEHQTVTELPIIDSNPPDPIINESEHKDPIIIERLTIESSTLESKIPDTTMDESEHTDTIIIEHQTSESSTFEPKTPVRTITNELTTTRSSTPLIPPTLSMPSVSSTKVVAWDFIKSLSAIELAKFVELNKLENKKRVVEICWNDILLQGDRPPSPSSKLAIQFEKKQEEEAEEEEEKADIDEWRKVKFDLREKESVCSLPPGEWKFDDGTVVNVEVVEPKKGVLRQPAEFGMDITEKIVVVKRVRYEEEEARKKAAEKKKLRATPVKGVKRKSGGAISSKPKRVLI